jgi:hypothetical protein
MCVPRFVSVERLLAAAQCPQNERNIIFFRIERRLKPAATVHSA